VQFCVTLGIANLMQRDCCTKSACQSHNGSFRTSYTNAVNSSIK